ncbi:phosphoenolpyruvate--protein phosphotransferase [Candidatus Riflebacteria bacterium]
MSKKLLKGTPGSPGYCKGKVHLVQAMDLKAIQKVNITDAELEGEIARYQRSVATSKRQLQTLISGRIYRQNSLEISNIFEAHLLLYDDPDYRSEIIKRIRTEKANVEYVVSRVTMEYHKMFKNLDDVLFQERAVDILDVGKRILKNLQNPTEEVARALVKPVEKGKFIIVAQEITPSDTLGMEKGQLLGMLSEEGGNTAHATILARELKIPYVFGIENIIEVIPDGSQILIDGLEGKVIVDPSEEETREFKELFTEFQRQYKELQHELKDTKAVTVDGVSICLQGNISNLEDVQKVLDERLEGVGLYRTEMDYLNHEKDAPTEEELFENYKKVFTELNPHPVTIRTFDFGSEKLPGFFRDLKEKNPGLGFRAIRLSLKEIELFKTQLKAIHRAAVFGNVSLLIPMVTVILEVRQVKAIITQCLDELKREGQEYREIPLGIMVEVPSVAFQMEQFLKEVDFVSIGSNDLTQYVLAADRNNTKVSNLYSSYDPAIIAILQKIITACNDAAKEVCLCGELAGDPLFTPALLAMGLRKFSMNPAFVPKVKQKIIHFDFQMCGAFLERLLTSDSAEAVLKLLKSDEMNETDPVDFQFY